MPAILMDPGEIRARISHIAASMRSEGVDLPGPSAAASPAAALVDRLPSWIARWGSLAEGENIWIYGEPCGGTGSSPSGQVLIGLPAGRYLVDTFDTVLRTAISRESAAGNPLVIGLVSVPGPFLLWIRPIGRISHPR